MIGHVALGTKWKMLALLYSAAVLLYPASEVIINAMPQLSHTYSVEEKKKKMIHGLNKVENNKARRGAYSLFQVKLQTKHKSAWVRLNVKFM